MHIVVLYESMFGNTRKVAEAIADGFRPDHSVLCQQVDSAGTKAVSSADLLVIGAPTHVRSLSRPSTRQNAAEQAAQPNSTMRLEPGATGMGIREWLQEDHPLPKRAAVFDTRRNINVLLSGRAGRTIQHLLHQRGVALVSQPESFLVDADNHLLPEELERATTWARQLGRRVEPVQLRGQVDDLL